MHDNLLLKRVIDKKVAISRFFYFMNIDHSLRCLRELEQQLQTRVSGRENYEDQYSLTDDGLNIRFSSSPFFTPDTESSASLMRTFRCTGPAKERVCSPFLDGVISFRTALQLLPSHPSSGEVRRVMLSGGITAVVYSPEREGQRNWPLTDFKVREETGAEAVAPLEDVLVMIHRLSLIEVYQIITAAVGKAPVMGTEYGADSFPLQLPDQSFKVT